MNRSDCRDTVDSVTIDTGYIRPGIAAMYMMVERGHAAFVDTGTTHSLPAIIGAMSEHGVEPENVDYVMPTHVHLDHAGGAGIMMDAFPNAQLVIHPRGARHMQDPTRLWQGTVAVYGKGEAERLYGQIRPVDSQRILITEDNMTLDFRGRILQILHTPGHAKHHYCVHDARYEQVFAGDTFGISYPVLSGPSGPFVFPTTSPVDFDPDQLHRSIDRLAALKPARMFITHFGGLKPSSEIVRELHCHIDQFVNMMDNAAADVSSEMLTSQISHYLLARAKRHGVSVSDSRIEATIKMDARLNADGLIVWKSRSIQ